MENKLKLDVLSIEINFN